LRRQEGTTGGEPTCAVHLPTERLKNLVANTAANQPNPISFARKIRLQKFPLLCCQLVVPHAAFQTSSFSKAMPCADFLRRVL